MTEVGRHVSEESVRQAEWMHAEGRSVDDILGFLKDEGANAIASINVLRRVLSVSVAEAQQLLHDSESWKSMRR